MYCRMRLLYGQQCIVAIAMVNYESFTCVSLSKRLKFQTPALIPAKLEHTTVIQVKLPFIIFSMRLWLLHESFQGPDIFTFRLGLEAI